MSKNLYKPPKADLSVKEEVSESKKVNVFILFNIVLSLPLWFMYFFGVKNNEFYLWLSCIWHCMGLLLYIKSNKTCKVIVVMSYVYLLSLSIFILYGLGPTVMWSLLFHPSTYVMLIVVFLQYNYIVVLNGFVKSEKARLYFDGRIT